ncbi:unnamed protein product [Closterium sp. NIES-54]
MVTTTTPWGLACVDLHVHTDKPSPSYVHSSLYTLATEPSQLAASAQVSASGQLAASCSCRLLSHQTLLWHHRLGHPSLPRLRGMHSRLLVSGLPRSLPPLPTSPAPPCLPCVEGRQRAAPHSSSFPPTTAPLQTLHMDVWGPARVSGQSGERYFLLVVDDYMRYTLDVLIPWIPTVRLQLRERFGQDLPVLRLHSDRGGEFSSNLLRDFCRGEGILQSHGGRSYLHDPCGAPHFLWPYAVQYAAHQLNLWPCVSLPETSPTLRWTGEVGDASVFRSRSTSRFLSTVSSPTALPPPPPPLQPLFLAPGPPPVDPLPPQGPAPSGVSQVDPLPGPLPVQVAVGSGAARGAESGGAEPGGAGSEGAETGGAEPGGVGTGGAQSGDYLCSKCVSGLFDAHAFGVELPGLEVLELLDLEVLGTPSSTGLTPPLLCPPPDQSQPPLQPASPLPAPSPYTEQSGGLTERRELASRLVSPVRTARRAPRSRPPPVPGTHAMALRPSSVPLCVPLPPPPESSLPEVPDPESDRLRAVSPAFSRLFATTVTDPSFESAAASALVGELLDFAAACRLDYATSLVAESTSARPPAVGDPDAPDIPTPRSYVEVITGPYSSQWQAAMDAEMASWKSTGTYIDKVPPPGANIVDGMWIFRVKRPPGSPPAFKARYVARDFSQGQGVDYFQTFTPTPKMTTFRVLLHIAAQRDYELHSLDFSTAFLQGSLHEEIWLRRPPGFTGLFPADPSLFLCTDTSLLPFYVLVYFDDLVFVTADTEALTLVNSALQKRHTCTDLGELRSYLGLQVTRDRARCTITLTQSHMVHQVLQRFGFQFSLPQPTPLSTSHSLSAPPSDDSVEPSGPYPELVGCLIYLMTCTRPDLAYPLSLLARYVAPGRQQKVH